ncbi:MAG: hypothetical protein H7839_24255, partial [Magnetococcus sp. YQC-5]
MRDKKCMCCVVVVRLTFARGDAWAGECRVNLVKFFDARSVSRSERLRLFFARKEPENHANGAH